MNIKDERALSRALRASIYATVLAVETGSTATGLPDLLVLGTRATWVELKVDTLLRTSQLKRIYELIRAGQRVVLVRYNRKNDSVAMTCLNDARVFPMLVDLVTGEKQMSRQTFDALFVDAKEYTIRECGWHLTMYVSGDV